MFAVIADLQDHRGGIMATIIATMKVMPDSPDRDMDGLAGKIEEAIAEFGKVYKKSTKPVAFGLSALVYAVQMEEKKGGTDPLEEKIKEIEGVNDVQVTDVTRSVDVSDL